MAEAFRLEERPDGVAVLSFDAPGKKVNTLSRAVFMELAGHITALESRADLKGLLFQSGKPGQFIAGADLGEIGALAFAPPGMLEQVIDFGHHLFGRIGQLPFPTVALIDGACMGGGTELVLAMDDRIAAANPNTTIGLPETKIGLLPAWGGTQRLPRLIGLNAIEMIVGGEPASAQKAAALGIVYDAVPPDRLIDAGLRRLESLREDDAFRERRKRLAQPLGLAPDAAAFAFGVAEGATRAKTKGQYPAPLAALKAMRTGLEKPLDEGLKAERAEALGLFGSPIAGHLVGLFFAKQKAGRDPSAAGPLPVPAPIGRVGVLGAGLMGAGIATAFARSGLPVTMVDVDESRLADGMKRAAEVVRSRIAIGRATPEDLGKLLGALSTSTRREALADCDLVVEAVTEHEPTKLALLGEIGRVMKPGALLATNTSTISITRLAAAATDPGRFVGMHFFYPVDRMELVEVIRGERTGDEAVSAVVALAKRLRKTPIVVRDGPGFLVNRILFPYMNEALVLLGEGASMDAIDVAAEKFGMPMGPIALQDLVGLDTSAAAGKVLSTAFPDRAMASPLLEELVAAGRLGKKTGAGFRSHAGKKGRPEADPAVAPILDRHRAGTRVFSTEELTDRLFLPMLLEATRVLEEGLAGGPADVDLGLILGIGFPPWRGGLLKWADSEGWAKIRERLGPYRPLGPRFEPTTTLTNLAESGKTIYPAPGGGGS